ncbi:pyridoxal phosphate-dependent transferase [Aspergillus leporis]|jgi:adenosylmethionine-8-amino-7-oxononanoate aminotransferase|uniref:Pyridoxal phosphate-dependent transferase n=1 Tax=Aspergillus leporis TaxID=41062 RepID=A0A5N5X2Y6_9EURO|nr:pyridoxal phosphate-dependent transferase [Aspergillus leporis]
MSPSRVDDDIPASMPFEGHPQITKTSGEGHLLHRSLVEHPARVESAEGLMLHLSDGRAVIDACAGAAVALIGHGQEEVHEAIMKQMQSVSYVHTQSYTTSSAEDLANFILHESPHGLEKAFFVGSGSEAIESALKLARQYFYEKNEPQRLHFVSRQQSYHGNTLASMSISSNLARKVPFAGFEYPHTSHVSPAYAYRHQGAGETEVDFTARLLRELDAEFLRIGPEKIIAFVAEPIVGATAGCVTAPAGYYAGVRALCHKYGILLILDEIMCGVGRSGTFFAFEQENVIPDIVTIAKGLGGGYAPIAGVLVHRKVIDVFRQGSNAFNHGHTYQAHPVSCAAALAVQRIVRRENLVARCATLGKALERLLRTELAHCPSVGDIRGRGLFWAVEFVQDRQTKAVFDPTVRFGSRVQRAAFDRGVAVYPGAGTVDGICGDHILLAPPFTVTEEELQHICQILREAIESQEKECLPS